MFNYYNNNKPDNNKKEPETENKEESLPNKETETPVVTLPSAPLNSKEYKNLTDGEYITTKGNTLKIENGITTIDGYLIVNKTYSLPSNYKPSNTYQTINAERCNNCIDKTAMSNFKLMQSDAKSIGLNIYIASGYRSYSYQERLYNNYTAVSGVEKADTYSARPGHSEHQTGLCFDLNSVDDSFANTSEGKWINNNAHLYGFIIRYPKGKDNITGYQYESWHLRYVGEDLAKKLYNDGDWLTMEEYFGINSQY